MSGHPEDRQPAAGFKALTAENWMEADPTNGNFVRLSAIAGPVAMTETDWARQFLSVRLHEQVPAEIVDLFAVARGAMLYGWFFYPLFRLGEEQLYRVAETAARMAYQARGGARSSPRFTEAIAFLVEHHAISADDQVRWDALRQLRNLASHPALQSVMPPGAVLGILMNVAKDIDRLFDPATD